MNGVEPSLPISSSASPTATRQRHRRAHAWVHAQRISVSQVAETPRRAHGDLTTAERLGGNAAYDPSDNEMVISPIADGP